MFGNNDDHYYRLGVSSDTHLCMLCVFLLSTVPQGVETSPSTDSMTGINMFLRAAKAGEKSTGSGLGSGGKGDATAEQKAVEDYLASEGHGIWGNTGRQQYK